MPDGGSRPGRRRVRTRTRAGGSGAVLGALRPRDRDALEGAAYKTGLLLFLAQLYKQYLRDAAARGAVRDNNPVMFRLLGPDTGYDAISGVSRTAQPRRCSARWKAEDAHKDHRLLPQPDRQRADHLRDRLRSGRASPMIQHGSAWWFNDTKHGMGTARQPRPENSVLANFVGMLTDSRNFLSYTRHSAKKDPCLCDLIGKWVENGEYPRYGNAQRDRRGYFLQQRRPVFRVSRLKRAGNRKERNMNELRLTRSGPSAPRWARGPTRLPSAFWMAALPSWRTSGRRIFRLRSAGARFHGASGEPRGRRCSCR